MMEWVICGQNWTMPASSPAPVPGSTALPSGFPHPHASEEARAIAENGMILRVQVGSGVHGTSITGQDDRDEMGLCLEPPQFVTGLARVPEGTGRLAPSVVPDEEVVFRNKAGAELAGNAHRFVSRLAASRYLGYLQGQKAAMTGQPGAHTNRPELVAVHGYDTKYAMHALRLGLQVLELLSTGRITLPVPEPHRAYLRSIRRGERPLGEVLEAISDAEARLAALRSGLLQAQAPRQRKRRAHGNASRRRRQLRV